MKEKKSKREWVKTFAIIFLAILLVLTLCSNTIQNYSLPEVSAQYVYSGTVTNKIRGSGTVVANDPYAVNTSQSRKIASVEVRVGDTVEKGDVIYTLEDGDSEELTEAKDKLKELQNAYESAIIEGGVSSSVTNDIEKNGTGDLATNQAKLAAAKARVEGLEAKVEKLQKQKDDYNDEYNNEGDKKTLADLQKLLKKAQDQLVIDEANVSDAETKYNDAKSAVSEKKKAIAEIEDIFDKIADVSSGEGAKLRDDYDGTEGKNLYDLEQELKELKSDLKKLDEKQKKAKKTYDATVANKKATEANIANYEAAIENTENSIGGTQHSLSKQLSDAQAALDDAKEAYDKIREEITLKYGLEDKLDAIKAQEKEIAKLSEETVGGTIKAPIAGSIISLNYSAGQTINVKESNEVATIQKSGDEYSLEMSITNNQARLVNVGDEAEVSNSWYYSDVHARVKSVRPDPTNPSANKIVVFEVEGEGLSNGQTLNLTVGNRTGNYDMVVPNSAIKEDTNGKYVLRVLSKSTPLGNRYIAEKVEVTVLAEDDTNTAISGNLDNYGEYIITTATKPIDDGQQVRLKD